MAQAPVLSNLSPIIENEGGYALLANAVHEADFDAVLNAQAKDLQGTFDVLGEVLGAHASGFTRAMNGPALTRFYSRIGRHYGFVQTQVPAIFPQPSDISLGDRSFTQFLKLFIEREGLSLFMADGNFGHDRPDFGFGRTTSFGFISVVRGEGADKRLFALPYVSLDREVLNATTAHPKGASVLRDFQTLMGIVNHDYYHQMTASAAGPYDAVTSSVLDVPMNAYAEARYLEGPFAGFKYNQAAYEKLGLVSHKAVFGKMYERDAGFRQELVELVDRYFDDMAIIADTLPNTTTNDRLGVGKYSLYMAQLFISHLSRVVDPGHPLMDAVRDAINRNMQFAEQFKDKFLVKRTGEDTIDSATFIERLVQKSAGQDHKVIHEPAEKALEDARVNKLGRYLKFSRAGLALKGG